MFFCAVNASSRTRGPHHKKNCEYGYNTLGLDGITLTMHAYTSICIQTRSVEKVEHGKTHATRAFFVHFKLFIHATTS